MSIKKSLLKKMRGKKSNIEKVNRHVHLVAGKHEHKINYSNVPVTADELKKMHDLNPKYADKLFDIVEASMKIEEEESRSYYEAVRREQDNDELSINLNYKKDRRGIFVAFLTIIFLMFCGSLLIYFGHKAIGGIVVTTVIISVVVPMIRKTDENKTSERLENQ